MTLSHRFGIIDQWRLCFRFDCRDAWDVEIVDYHRRAIALKTTTKLPQKPLAQSPVNGMRPIHPCEVLREEFLLPMGLSAHALAMALQVPAPRINDIVRERRSVTVDTALRMAHYFGTSPDFWLGLQTDYDMARARASMGAALARIVRRDTVELP